MTMFVPIFRVEITNFLLGVGYLSKISQTLFLINLSESLDTDSQITTDLGKNIQNVPKELVFLQIAIF